MANGIVWYMGASLDGASENPVVAKGYDEADNLIYQIRWGGVIYGDVPRVMAADASGHLYMAHRQYSYPTSELKTAGEFFRVYRRNGDRIAFPSLHGNYILAIAIDESDGSIYVGGYQNASDSYYSFRKYDSSGSLLWSKSSEIWPYYVGNPPILSQGTHTIHAIQIDGSGNVYTASSTVEAGELSKYQSDGTHLWTVVLNAPITGMVLDGAGYIYTLNYGGSGYYALNDYDPNDVSANLVYYNTSSDTYDIVKWDTDGNYISGIDALTAAGISRSGNTPLELRYKNSTLFMKSFYYPTVSYFNGHVSLFNTSLAFISKTLSVHRTWNDPYYLAPITQMDVNDTDGTVYLAGSQVSSIDSPLSVYYENVQQLPSIPLPLALAIPETIGDRYTSIPALPIYLALAAPKVIREYAGVFPLATVYRLYLTGGSGTVELPMSSFTCRRGYGVLSMTAICPGLSDAQIQQVIDRTDGTLIIKRGIRLRDGTEQLDEILAAPMDETTPYRWDAGSSRASASLNARDTAEIANPKTRTVRGASYRNLSDGRRRARCAVDTYLQPGDTADLGGEETMIVAEITYSVSPTREVMEIVEAAS